MSPVHPFRLWVLPPLVLMSFWAKSQNLVPNPGFETYSQCPNMLSQIERAVPWIHPTAGSTDFFHACAPGNSYSVPNNFFGNQPAHSGNGYAGAYFKLLGGPYREYLSVPLTEPLESGYGYEISFWLNLTDTNCGSDQVGAYLSQGPIPFGGQGVLIYEPQFEYTGGLLNDYDNWVLISGCFIAEGGEDWLTLGNFSDDDETVTDPDCTEIPHSYYYFDDVSLEKGDLPDPIDFDLGDPVFGCDMVSIGAGITNVHYHWSTGSRDSSIVVTVSGMYILTVSSGCTQGIDSVLITVHGTDPVDLGPEDVSFCEGESYIITLDPVENEYLWQDGSNESTYTISTSGVYRVSLDDGCNTSVDEVTVTVISVPEDFSLGDDAYLCPNSSIEFDFDADLGNFLWQDNSSSSFYSITSPGLYSLTISNVCGEAIDAIEVFPLLLPSFTFGPDSVFLCDAQDSTLLLDEDLGYFTWQDGSHENMITISSPGLIRLSISNDCGEVSDSMEVLYASAPVFNLGVDTTICSAPSYLLDVSSTVGQYLWQDSSTQSSFLATLDGTYAVSIANACGMQVDSITLKFLNSIPPVSLGPDFNLCPGDQFVLTAGPANGNIRWQDGSTADTFLVTLPGEYIVEVSNECNVVSDTLLINGNGSPPHVDLPDQLSLCQGDFLVLKTNVSGVSYSWSDASQKDSLVISTPGIYSVTVTNACGSDVDSTTVIDLGFSPSISLGNDVSLCPGDSVVLSPDLNNATSWIWGDATSDSTFQVHSNTTVSIEVSNDCGIAVDTLNVFLLAATPSVDLGHDTSLCIGHSVLLEVNTPGISIQWSDGSSDPQLLVVDTGAVYVVVSNSCGENSDTLQIELAPAIPTLNLGADQSLCPGETISFAPGILNVDYIWSDGSVENFFNTTQAGQLSLTISNSCGVSSDTVLISETTQGPQVNLGPDVLGCEGDVITLMSDISGVDFQWQDGSTFSTLATDVSGTFILSVSNNCGSDLDTIEVDLHGLPPSTNLGFDTTLCDGNTLVLISAADAETQVMWQDGSILPQFVVDSTGEYIISEVNHCGSHADTIQVEYLKSPDPFELGTDTILCPGTSLLLHAPVTTALLQWQDGSSSSTFLADKAQSYTLTISNDCGSVVDALWLNYDDLIPNIGLDSPLMICPEEIIVLDVTQPFPVTYEWNTGSTFPQIQITVPGLYSISISTPCANAYANTVVIASDSCFDSTSIYIPNVFSPNGDQVNDFFSVGLLPGAEINAMHTWIFDRWGNLVFSSETIPPVWDGTYRDKALNAGVFVYRIEVEFPNKTTILHGDITLIR